MVLFVLLCSSLVVSVDAASMWSQTYGGEGIDVACSLVATSDGGYAIAGEIGFAMAALVKTDAFGNMQWNKTYGASWGVAYSVVATSDGGYAIAGVWDCSSDLWFFDMIFSSGDAWLVKTDALGNMQRNRTYGGTGADVARSLVATTDGGYAIAGTYDYAMDIFYSNRGDFWLVKTMKTGFFQSTPHGLFPH